MWVVQAKEEGSAGKKEINRVLYTSYKVENREEAVKIIKGLFRNFSFCKPNIV
jgi:hypothetical protein